MRAEDSRAAYWTAYSIAKLHVVVINLLRPSSKNPYHLLQRLVTPNFVFVYAYDFLMFFFRNIYAKRRRPNAAPTNTQFSDIYDLAQISYFYPLKHIAATQFLPRDLQTLDLASNPPLT